MVSDAFLADYPHLHDALAVAGEDEIARNAIFDLLREAQLRSEDPPRFREEVRWPVIVALLGRAKTHRMRLDNGLVFELHPDNRIDKALLLSSVRDPDHVWEPQTTKLLVALAASAGHVIVGGAYNGDQVLLLAHALSRRHPPGIVHAFEPMEEAFKRLLRNIELNNVTNVVVQRGGLWNRTGASLYIEGEIALASLVAEEQMPEESRRIVKSIAIDDYVADAKLTNVGLVMLDIEGGEETALEGARNLLCLPWPQCPHVVFEVHGSFVNWSAGLANTSIVALLTSHGYTVFAVRDFHDNHSMAGYPIEIIPTDSVHLEGPPHGFNMLATKDPLLVQRLGLRIVTNVSPKLLLDKEGALHHPKFGPEESSRRADDKAHR
jgi:FkbM family methyltransferase